jgi:hypothetical protein
MNPGDAPARVLLRFLRFDATQSSMYLVRAGKARTTLEMRANQNLGQTDFSTTIEADQLIVADRTMSWAGDQAYGSASETAITTPALRWLLAEGATHGGFDLFYLPQNANNTAAQVHIRYLLPSGEVLEKDYIVEPQSRKTVYVDTEDIPGHGLALAATDVSAIIEVTNNQPIIVERSMYVSTNPPHGQSLLQPGRQQVAGRHQKSRRVAMPNVRGWFVRKPMRARVLRSRSKESSARSSVTLLTYADTSH